MTIDNVMPVLRVADLDRAIAFYVERLGFTLAWRLPDEGGGENALLQSGRVEVIVTTGLHLGGRPAFTGTLYFNMSSGVDALWRRLQHDVVVVWPLEEMEHGTREFGIRDPDGYMLAFAQRRGDRR